MKTLIYGIIPFLFLFYSCNEFHGFFPKSTFDAPYPMPDLNVEKELGSYLVVKRAGDTLYLRISGAKNKNVISDMLTGDTLFKGKVSRHKGLYFFSQQISDTAYWIYAVKRDENLIYGIASGHEQAMHIDKEILKGNYPQLVKYIDTSRQVIRLYPEAEQLRQLLVIVIDSMVPDTILYRSGGPVPLLNKSKGL